MICRWYTFTKIVNGSVSANVDSLLSEVFYVHNHFLTSYSSVRWDVYVRWVERLLTDQYDKVVRGGTSLTCVIRWKVCKGELTSLRPARCLLPRLKTWVWSLGPHGKRRKPTPVFHFLTSICMLWQTDRQTDWHTHTHIKTIHVKSEKSVFFSTFLKERAFSVIS